MHGKRAARGRVAYVEVPKRGLSDVGAETETMRKLVFDVLKKKV